MSELGDKGTQDDPNLKEQHSLLTELFAVQERQTQLHHKLSQLVSEELAFSRYLVEAKSAGAFKNLTALTSKAVAEFREREAAIMGGLKGAHEEIRRISKALRVPPPQKPSQ